MLERSASQLLLHISDASGMLNQDAAVDCTSEAGLSSRRELMNLLDAEPLLDYLVQNGVISKEEMHDILNDEDTIKQNIGLLKYVEKRPNGVKLFTNVLRQTGQHYLANLVDDGIRIRALSGSGYLSKSRHKGQVSLKIRIRSMKLQQATFKTVSELLHKDWISLEDIQMKMSSIKKLQSQSQRSSMVDRVPSSQHASYVELTMAPPETVCEEPITTEEEVEESGCCFCCCSSRKTAHKSSKKYTSTETGSKPNGQELVTFPAANTQSSAIAELNDRDPADRSGSVVVTCQPSNKLSGSLDLRVAFIRNGHGSIKRCDNSMENLRKVANSIQEKCVELLCVISDANSSAHSGLLRYLEQDRGVLVLCMELVGDVLDLLLICTKPDHVNLMRSDHSAGKLTADLEHLIANPDILQMLGIAGVKLDVELDSDDLDIVLQELA